MDKIANQHPAFDKLSYFAGMAMRALLPWCTFDEDGHPMVYHLTMKKVAKTSVDMAQHMMDALEDSKGIYTDD